MNEGDEHVLELISRGEPDGWRQFVSRFQGRLTAFAFRQVGSADTADDLVQETFVSFLRAIDSYRRDCELESFLFQILRRRIVDHFRRLGKIREVPVCSLSSDDSTYPLDSADHRPIGTNPNERDEFALAGLSYAVREFAGRLRESQKFRDLKIAEGVFFAGRGNQEIAKLISISENEVAVVKRRMIQKLARHLQQFVNDDKGQLSDVPLASDLLSHVWQQLRPSCPKRTTLGKYTLGILPDDWDVFVRFHVDVLGCSFCRANLDELKLQESGPPQPDDRLFQSTIGFFRSRSGQSPS